MFICSIFTCGIFLKFLRLLSTCEWTNMLALCKCAYIIIVTMQNNVTYRPECSPDNLKGTACSKNMPYYHVIDRRKVIKRALMQTCGTTSWYLWHSAQRRRPVRPCSSSPAEAGCCWLVFGLLQAVHYKMYVRKCIMGMGYVPRAAGRL